MTLPRDPATIDGRHCEHVDPEDFFPQPEDMSGLEAAKRVCIGNPDIDDACPALTVCLEFAMYHETGLSHAARSGVFGGMSARARARLHTERVNGGNPPERRTAITDTKECEACGVTVRRHKQSKTSWATLRFCSKACHTATVRYPGLPDTKNCERCNEPFTKNGRHGKAWIAAKYCSNSCSYAAQWSQETA